MRILIFSLFFYPEPIGISKYTGEMAFWLAARDHEVEVITAFPNYPDWKVDPHYVHRSFHSEFVDKVRIYRTPVSISASHRVTTKQRIALEIQFAINSLRFWIPVLLFKRYDVVFAVCPPTQLGLFPCIYSFLRRTPWIFHVQDLQADAALRLGMINGGWGQLLYKFEYWLLRKATRVSTITEAMRRHIVGKGIPAENVWLFPNWSDISTIRPSTRENSFRKRFRFTDNQTVFMYAGNMGEKQGLELVIRAASHFQDMPDIQFVMVGNGAARQRLELLGNEKKLNNVHFLAVQPVELLSELLASADVHMIIQKPQVADFVMPSKLTNILAAGRPVIATAEEGTTLQSILVANGAGRVIDPEDLQAFIKAVLLLHNSLDLREELGKNARQYAEEFMDKERILSSFEAQLMTFLEGRGRQNVMQVRKGLL
jgi:colanic acid biosynthesis glycosyl transferase WcaI